MGPEGAVNILYRRELGEAADPARLPGRAGRRVPREVRQPLRGGGARLRRRRHRAPRDAPRGSSRRWRPCAPSATRTRPASTGTCRCERSRGAAGHRARRPATPSGPAGGRPGALGAGDPPARARADARARAPRDVLGRAGAPPGDARGPRGLRLRRASSGSPGSIPYTRGRPADDVPGPPLDDAAVRRVRDRGRDQPAVPLPPRAGADGAVGRLRPADADGARRRRPGGAERGRARGGVHLERRRHGRAAPGPAARPRLDLDDDQRDRRHPAGALPGGGRAPGRAPPTRWPAPCRTTSSRSSSRAGPTSSRRAPRSGS